MTDERLALLGRLQKAEKDLEKCSLRCDDIVKTIQLNIRPIPPGQDYLDDINVAKFELQSADLVEELKKRTKLKETVAALRKELE